VNLHQLKEGEVSTADSNTPEPQMVIVAECISDTIINPYNKSQKFPKSSLGLVVVFIDFLVIISFLVFTWILQSSQEAYVKQFRNDTLEMTDFAIRVKRIPHDKKYGDDDEILRAFLTAHF